MLDKIIQTVVQEVFKNGESNSKFNIKTQLLSVAKMYSKYLIIFLVSCVVLLVLWFWLIWNLFSGTISSGSDIISEAINPGSGIISEVWLPNLQKVEEVWINGIIEQPLQFLRDIWLGKDGK